jgi:hypothetical protein
VPVSREAPELNPLSHLPSIHGREAFLSQERIFNVFAFLNLRASFALSLVFKSNGCGPGPHKRGPPDNTHITCFQSVVRDQEFLQKVLKAEKGSTHAVR